MFCNRASDVGCLCDQITSYTASYSALTPSLLRTVGFTDISYTVLSSADLEVVTLALFILSDVIKQSVDSNESPGWFEELLVDQYISEWVLVFFVVWARGWRDARSCRWFTLTDSGNDDVSFQFSRNWALHISLVTMVTAGLFTQILEECPKAQCQFFLFLHFIFTEESYRLQLLHTWRWTGEQEKTDGRIKSGTASTSPADIKHTWTN